jgi:hypothetical protein
LHSNQFERRSIRTVEQRQFELELDPEVPHMTDRLPQPSSKPSPTGRGHPVNNAPRPRVTRFGTSGLGQALCDEPVQRAVGLGGTHGENPPQPPTGPNSLAKAKPCVGCSASTPNTAWSVTDNRVPTIGID